MGKRPFISKNDSILRPKQKPGKKNETFFLIRRASRACQCSEAVAAIRHDRRVLRCSVSTLRRHSDDAALTVGNSTQFMSREPTKIGAISRNLAVPPLLVLPLQSKYHLKINCSLHC